MSGIIYDGKKYMKLCNDHQLKFLSLEDNVYFLLRDIFLNISGIDYIMEANSFNRTLSGGIFYEDRNDDFKYTNELDSKYYLYKLVNWLNYIDKSDFEFSNPDPDEEINIKDYLLFDVWWYGLEKLKKKLNDKLNNTINTIEM